MTDYGSVALGVIVLLLTSCMDALGYNIQRRDHCKNALLSKPRHECFRKYWHLGFYIYVTSLLIGNIIAINMVQAHWVAPISTSSLIFNVIFARFLVGSRITRRDIIGTGIIILAILAILFLSTRHDPNKDVGMDIGLEVLNELFSKLSFQIYFSVLNGIMLGGFALYTYLVSLIRNPEKLERASKLTFASDLKILSRNTAILISVLGGMGASETVILARSGISLLKSVIGGDWVFSQPVPILVIVGLGYSAVFQLYCLNAGLKLADSVLVGPIFSSVYNIFSLFNALVFLDQFLFYSWWILFLMILSVMMLVVGIVVLSSQAKSADNLPVLPRFKCKPKRELITTTTTTTDVTPTKSKPIN